jgi:predicted ATP-dependent endonuclease of OLD family
MKYLKFEIENYRGISRKLSIDLNENSLIPLIGINECGKTTILQAIYCFDHINDNEYDSAHLGNLINLYQTSSAGNAIITATLEITKRELETIININNERDKNNSEQAKVKGQVYKEQFIEVDLNKIEFKNIIVLQRNLTTKEYLIINDEYQYLKPCVEIILESGLTP